MTQLRGSDLIGKRVEIPVHYDLWMQGARTGRVISGGKLGIRVKLDHPQVRRPITVAHSDVPYMKVLS